MDVIGVSRTFQLNDNILPNSILTSPPALPHRERKIVQVKHRSVFTSHFPAGFENHCADSAIGDSTARHRCADENLRVAPSPGPFHGPQTFPQLGQSLTRRIEREVIRPRQNFAQYGFGLDLHLIRQGIRIKISDQHHRRALFQRGSDQSPQTRWRVVERDQPNLSSRGGQGKSAPQWTAQIYFHAGRPRVRYGR